MKEVENTRNLLVLPVGTGNRAALGCDVLWHRRMDSLRRVSVMRTIFVSNCAPKRSVLRECIIDALRTQGWRVDLEVRDYDSFLQVGDEKPLELVVIDIDLDTSCTPVFDKAKEPQNGVDTAIILAIYPAKAHTMEPALLKKGAAAVLFLPVDDQGVPSMQRFLMQQIPACASANS